jgi:hypothetical protein
MLFARARMPALFVASALVAAYLTGCASKPTEAPKPPVIAQPAPQSSIEKFQAVLDDGITLDYQVEKKVSKVNSKSCFAFITGKLNNVSERTVSKKSVLDIAVFGQGKQLYRDLTSPLADIPSGFNSVFEMVVSPVFADGCPTFDHISIALRKVVL